MASLLARQGRHRQRYDEELRRLVAGCIPYRLRENNDDPIANLGNILEVLMISSPDRDDLVFPKGGWEDDETVGEAACREALEEAGVKGILDEENPLGVYDFRSKSSENSCSLKGYCRGYMFALEVTEEYNSWAEDDDHRRIWLNVAQAYKFCRYEWMQRALVQFLRVMSETGKYEMGDELVSSPAHQSQDVLTEHPSMSPSCSFNNPSPQRLDEACECPVLG